MKFGVRQICNVVFRATTSQKIGSRTFEKGQPVFYLDTAKTSSLEGAATSVYAQGGRGNTRLISWEGEKTLTFTVEDALLSPISFSMLSGAGVVKSTAESGEQVHFHQTTATTADNEGIIDLSNALEPGEEIDTTAPLFIMPVDEYGDITGEVIKGDFSLYKSAQDSDYSGQKIMYSKNLDTKADYANFNNYKNAYKYPYFINENHTATTEEIEGWKANDKVIQPKYGITNGVVDNSATKLVLSQPIPYDGRAILRTAVENNKMALVINKEIFSVSNSETGVNETLPLPAALKNPIFSVKALIQEVTAIGAGNMICPQRDPLPVFFRSIITHEENGSSQLYTLSDNAADDWYQVKQYYYKQGAKEASQVTTTHPTEISLGFYTKTNAPRYNADWGYFIGIQKIATWNDDGTPQTYSGDIIPIKLNKDVRNFLIRNYFGQTTSSGLRVVENGTANGIIENQTQALRDSFTKAYKATLAYHAFKSIINKPFVVDYYVTKSAATVTELQIDATNFAGYYYVEADTLFRRQIDGKDLPANLTFPNVKIQSNFTFSMASTGDPSTFTFTMDAFPGYTYFDKSKKVLCAIQIVDDKSSRAGIRTSVFPHKAAGEIEASKNDSSPEIYDEYEHAGQGVLDIIDEG